MKILIASDTYYPHVNGASYFAQRLAKAMNEQGHDVAVISPSISIYNSRSINNNIVVYGIWSISILFYKQFRFCLFSLFINGAIEKAITEFNPDIVHIQGHFFVSRTALNVAKKHGIPVIATNHFMPDNLTHYLHLPKKLTFKINQLLWSDFSRVFRKADYVTTPTLSAASLLPPLHTPVKVVSNGIDLHRFNQKNDGEYLRKKYQLSNKPILLYVGRLDREKNLEVIILSLTRLTDRSNIQFLIVGTGAQGEALKQLIINHKLQEIVRFLGFVPDKDLPNLYALADCFINASTVELQSLVTMEAMATGLPIIAVRALALPELVHDGKNGFLFEVNDTIALAKHIERIFSNESLRKRMGKESLKIIIKHDIKETINKFEEIYNTLISKTK